MKRLAIVFPGIGYTAEKPLLHYSRRIAERFGYETGIVPYSGFPKKVKGDKEKMLRSCEIALTQAKEFLAEVCLAPYEDVLFIGKSIGTVAAAEIAAGCPEKNKIRLIVYTPLEETFAHPLGDAVVFTGSGDPWVGGEASPIPQICAERDIPCFVIKNANHSLETHDPLLDNLIYPERAAVQNRLWLSGNGLLPGVMKGIANDRFDARRAQNRLEKRRTPCSDQRLGFLAYRGTLHRRAAAMGLFGCYSYVSER